MTCSSVQLTVLFHLFWTGEAASLHRYTCEKILMRAHFLITQENTPTLNISDHEPAIITAADWFCNMKMQKV